MDPEKRFPNKKGRIVAIIHDNRICLRTYTDYVHFTEAIHYFDSIVLSVSKEFPKDDARILKEINKANSTLKEVKRICKRIEKEVDDKIFKSTPTHISD